MADNIAAISTGMVVSGVAVIRMSGDSPLSIAEKVFKPVGKTAVKDFTPNVMYVGEIDCGGFSDFGMCVYFKAPKSFTGEDIVEFHSHGGTAITRGILSRLIECGARLAANGEFTKRAFINGKLSLSSAEGLIDMINSESEAQAKAGYYLYREKLTRKVIKMQDELTDALSNIDADMDFPEEGLEISAKESVKKALSSVEEELDGLLKTYRSGRKIVGGVKVGICGKPNTGKSSLLNAILNYDKAIVSEVAGTTRDVVEGAVDINGVRFNFCDTAGIRGTDDAVEQVGVNLSKKILEESDLTIFVLDGTNIDKADDDIYEILKGKNILVVENKCDIATANDNRAELKVSALERINIQELKDLIYNKTIGKGIDINGDFLCEERHFNAIKSAKEFISSAVRSIDEVPLDVLSIDLKAAWDSLGEITGKTATEDIINNIFSKFCVGK